MGGNIIIIWKFEWWECPWNSLWKQKKNNTEEYCQGVIWVLHNLWIEYMYQRKEAYYMKIIRESIKLAKENNDCDSFNGLCCKDKASGNCCQSGSCCQSC